MFRNSESYNRKRELTTRIISTKISRERTQADYKPLDRQHTNLQRMSFHQWCLLLWQTCNQESQFQNYLSAQLWNFLTQIFPISPKPYPTSLRSRHHKYLQVLFQSLFYILRIINYNFSDQPLQKTLPDVIWNASLLSPTTCEMWKNMLFVHL